ncbi:MAG: hypothetical protein ACRENF_00120 [Thermodesulfobacteriota bacterium]
MIYVRTRSGRFLSLNHLVGFAIEEQNTEMEGKRIRIFNIIAYLPEPLYPAILSVYYDETTAEKELVAFMERLISTEKGIVGLETQI